MANGADYRSVLENVFEFPVPNLSGSENIKNLKLRIIMDNYNLSHELNEKYSTTTPILRDFMINDPELLS